LISNFFFSNKNRSNDKIIWKQEKKEEEKGKRKQIQSIDRSFVVLDHHFFLSFFFSEELVVVDFPSTTSPSYISRTGQRSIIIFINKTIRVMHLFLSSWLNYVVKNNRVMIEYFEIKFLLLLSYSEASAILKRLSERLYQHNNCEQLVDIDSLQQILDSPLFSTLYNLQESFQQLKFEFEKGNHSIRNCSFDFDIQGHLKLINEKITKQSKIIKLFFLRNKLIQFI
jgi:hypothetical protein